MASDADVALRVLNEAIGALSQAAVLVQEKEWVDTAAEAVRGRSCASEALAVTELASVSF